VGVVKMYDIKPNGRNIPVTDDNKMDYIQLMTQFRMYVPLILTCPSSVPIAPF
jgi:hypothetical protein